MNEARWRDLAESQGFEISGIADLRQPFAGHAHYENWLADGKHAGMDYLLRHAEARRSAEGVLPGAKSGLVVGKFYAQPHPAGPGQVKVARYALGRDYHNVLRQRLKKLLPALQAALPTAEFRICVDSAPLLEREMAQRAGLGWFGKNTMLIHSRRGSWFLIASVLTTAELEPSQPSVGGCGTCQACVKACPTGAIVQEEGRWQVDSRSCVSYWTIEHRGDIPAELAARFQGWTFGCDVCQEVCPFNQPRDSQPLRAAETADPDFLPRFAPPLRREVESWSEAQWDRFSLGSPIRRATFAGFRRNAGFPDE